MVGLTISHPVQRDRRYTVTQEAAGYPERRYVARFCGEFIASSLSYSAAAIRCVGHHAERMGALVITEERAR